MSSTQCATLNVSLASLQGHSDTLLHVIPTEDYWWYHRHFASAYIQDRLAEYYIRTRAMDMWTASSIAPTPVHATLCGHLFEFCCLENLAKGGRFPMRSLDVSSEVCMPSNAAFQRIKLHVVISCSRGCLQVDESQTFSLKPASHTCTTDSQRRPAGLSFAGRQPGIPRPSMPCCSQTRDSRSPAAHLTP